MDITYFTVTISQIQVSGKYFRMVSVSESLGGGSLRGGGSLSSDSLLAVLSSADKR